MTQAYCVKCKQKVNIKDPTEATFKNGTNVIKGLCETCNSKVFSIKSKNSIK